jgi:F-type H+-transporting ATPase subunit a
MPLVLALFTWAIYMVVGIIKQGPGHFLKNSTVPSGVPWWVLPLVVPIELLQVLIVRPFSLMVRLFANMLAGHILLVTFALLTESLVQAETHRPFLNIMGILPFGMLLFLTAFEVLVAFLQAYIFTILTAVYIGGAAHPEH